MCRLGGCAILVGSLLFSHAAAQNVGERLTDGTAIFDYTLNGNSNFPGPPPIGAGDVDFTFQLDGAPGDPAEQQIARGNWYYRINNDTRERFPTSNGSIKTTLGSNYVHWDIPEVFDGPGTTLPGLTVEMDFLLTSFGPDSASVDTGLCFENGSSSQVTVDAFFALDFELDGTAAGDVYDPLNPAAGRLITVRDGSTVGTLAGGSAFGIGAVGSAMNDDTTIFGQLNNGTPTTYIPDVNPGGGLFPDGAAVLHFQTVLPAFSQSVCFPVTFAVSRDPIIPEPAGITLAGCMLVGLALRRHRNL